VIAISAAGKHLGKLIGQDETGYRLSPVYDVALTPVQQANGQTAVVRQLMPVLLISVDIALGVDRSAAIIDLETLPASEKRDWFEMVKNVRAGMLQMRAARSGVVLPGR